MEPGGVPHDKAVTTFADEKDGTQNHRHAGVLRGFRARLVFECRWGGVYACIGTMFEGTLRGVSLDTTQIIVTEVLSSGGVTEERRPVRASGLGLWTPGTVPALAGNIHGGA